MGRFSFWYRDDDLLRNRDPAGVVVSPRSGAPHPLGEGFPYGSLTTLPVVPYKQGVRARAGGYREVAS